VGLPAVSQDLPGEDERLTQLLSQAPAAIVQFVDMGDDVAVLRTMVDSESTLHTEVRQLGMGAGSLRSINSCLRLVLRSSNPLATGLDLRRVRDWDKLASLLGSCLNDVSTELPLFIVAGPVGEASISIALGHRPLCFVPNVSGLVALRKRRLTRFPDLRWSLERWFDFTVWFDSELSAEAEALANIIGQGSMLASAYKMVHEGVRGKDATEKRLLAGLARADIARIACHGRFLPDAEAIDLLVAADGFLPPSNLIEISNSDAHVVNWQKLAALENAPVAVFSSACDSGIAVINPGGERLGLERPLFTRQSARAC